MVRKRQRHQAIARKTAIDLAKHKPIFQFLMGRRRRTNYGYISVRTPQRPQPSYGVEYGGPGMPASKGGPSEVLNRVNMVAIHRCGMDSSPNSRALRNVKVVNGEEREWPKMDGKINEQKIVRKVRGQTTPAPSFDGIGVSAMLEAPLSFITRR